MLDFYNRDDGKRGRRRSKGGLIFKRLDGT